MSNTTGEVRSLIQGGLRRAIRELQGATIDAGYPDPAAGLASVATDLKRVSRDLLALAEMAEQGQAGS